MIDIYYSFQFKKSIKKYSSYQKQIEKRIALFIQNPHDNRLKTHKLTGKLHGYWSFSINFNLRIIFDFIDQKKAGFIDIGTHQIYKKYKS